MNDLIYWIWLSLSCTPGSTTFARLLESFDNAKDIYFAEEGDIRKSVGSKRSDCSLLLNKDITKAEKIYEFCTSKGVGILTYEDENFPESLRDIPTPPVLLYYRGKLPDFNRGFRIAVVGTRKLSSYGRINAFKISYDLAVSGATVVSGMATGIDGVALAGAIAGGGVTVVFLGSGIDVCYPREHITLAREIVKNGCVFTEYPPGTKPLQHNFPKRNRLISGLCSATLVIEGTEGSGAMITARCAKEQMRRIYAFPGNVGNANSEASNLLIKNGASLCTSADDIVRDFEFEFKGVFNPYKLAESKPVNMDAVLREFCVSAVCPDDDIFSPPKKKKEETKPVEQIKDEKLPPDNSFEFDKDTLMIYKRIPMNEEISIEELVRDGETLRSVMKLLLKLEMGRFVEILPGERVKRN